MQTTQKRQEEDIQVRRATGPLHFVDANARAFPGHGTPLEQAFALAPMQVPAQYQPSLVSPHQAWPQVAGQPGAFQQVWPQSTRAQFAPINPLAGEPIVYPQGTSAQGNVQRVPACDIVDEGAEYVCQIELPGVKRENVDVSGFERALLIIAHAEPDIDIGALVLSERGATASFRRVITLPSDIQTANAKAALRDGILTINLPKAKPTAGPKRIPVA